jgi:hypothetical protein
MRNFFGNIFKSLSIITIIITVFCGFGLNLAIVRQVVGSWGVIICLILFPIVFAVAPWYELISHGNWFPLLVIYGGVITSSVLYNIGSFVSGKSDLVCNKGSGF